MYAIGVVELVAPAVRWPDSSWWVPDAWPGAPRRTATMIRHREGPPHLALTAVTLLLVMVELYRVTIA